MRKNDQRKSKKTGKSCGRICPAVLSLLILCSWMISSILVYGFDMSEMNSLDTGGFDMDVGEGTGQLPEDWEKSYGGTEKNDGNENREDENLMEDSSVWAGTEMDRRIQRDGVRTSRQKKYILRKRTLWETEILQQKIPVAAKKDTNFRNRIFGKMKIRG